MNGASVFTLGKYTVRVTLRYDNPAFPVYLIFRGAKFIGKQFSYPAESDGAWFEMGQGVYATQSHCLHAAVASRRKPGPGRPRKLDEPEPA